MLLRERFVISIRKISFNAPDIKELRRDFSV
jgi:hypothetical protein